MISIDSKRFQMTIIFADSELAIFGDQRWGALRLFTGDSPKSLIAMPNI